MCGNDQLSSSCTQIVVNILHTTTGYLYPTCLYIEQHLKETIVVTIYMQLAINAIHCMLRTHDSINLNCVLFSTAGVVNVALLGAGFFFFNAD